MGDKTNISWCDFTFNPWWGCTKVSPACDFCYAERDSIRYGHAIWGKDAPRRFFTDKHWESPLKWNRDAERDGVRRRVFCASMADVMEDRRDLDDWRDRLWKLIEATPNLDWLLLSKRPRNFWRWLPVSILDAGNVWLGTTVESPNYLWRIDDLKKTPCDVHFVSMEPLLAGVPMIGDYLDDIEWVIAGGETGGKGVRPISATWVRQIRDACMVRAVPFHLKQWGEYGPFHSGPISDLGTGPLETGGGHSLVQVDGYTMARFGKKFTGSLLDGREWREFPAVSR